MKFRKCATFILEYRRVFEFEIDDAELAKMDEEARESAIWSEIHSTAYNLLPSEVIKGTCLDFRLLDEEEIEDVPIPPLEQLAEAAE